jgi:hypothetical protein
MDPLHAIAAHHVSPVRRSAAEEIDAFDDDNAFETLHSARRAWEQFRLLVRGHARAVPQCALAGPGNCLCGPQSVA